jgi:hypothetical protein
MTNAKLDVLLQTLTKHGVRRFKDGYLEIELDPAARPSDEVEDLNPYTNGTKEREYQREADGLLLSEYGYAPPTRGNQ